jgi:prepilin-type N-terminal cleavage/methylation domain-containing protein
MKRGFTLAEVLMVLLIVTILAGIMFPVFSQTRSKARETGCSSNLRQIHLAVSLYREDHGEYPPNTLGWPGLKDYLPVVFRCPSTPPSQPTSASYTFFGSPPTIAGTPEDRKREELLLEAFLACREVRRSSMPIAMDMNHMYLEEAHNAGRKFFLILRDSGSVHSVDGNAVKALNHRDDLPCKDVSAIMMNL